MDELNREQLLEHLKTCSPRTRDTFIQMIEGKVSDNDSAAFVREKLAFVEPDMTPRQMTFVSSRCCDCGGLVTEQNKLVAKAECCGVLTCELCRSQCMCCGKTICKRHASTYADEDVRCPRCRWRKWLEIGLSLIGKGVKKWFEIY